MRMLVSTYTNSSRREFLRHLSGTTTQAAKLVDPHVSITPGQVNQLPPTTPLPKRPVEINRLRGTKLQSLNPANKSRSSTDIGAIVAFDLFLLRLVNELSRQQVPIVSLSAVLDQAQTMSGVQLDYALAYESTPSPDRRVHSTASSSAPNSQASSGIVVVAHVIGGQNPLVSVCSGFAVGPNHGTIQILTCLHTLDSVSR